LEDGPPIVKQDFSCPALLFGTPQTWISLTGLSPCFALVSNNFSYRMFDFWFTGLFRFRSPLLTESRLISFPPGTEMFQFPGFRFLTPMYSGWDTW
jgi:hypothetical protein